MKRAVYAIPAAGLLLTGCESNTAAPVDATVQTDATVQADAASDAPSTTAVCGDGIVALATEQCDDANTVDTDGCLSDCQLDPIVDKFAFDWLSDDPWCQDEYYAWRCQCHIMAPFRIQPTLALGGWYQTGAYCGQPGPADSTIVNLTGTVAIIEARRRYAITLQRGAELFTLDCTASSTPNTPALSCTVNNGEVWRAWRDQ